MCEWYRKTFTGVDENTSQIDNLLQCTLELLKIKNKPRSYVAVSSF